jgi:hypothetical protein
LGLILVCFAVTARIARFAPQLQETAPAPRWLVGNHTNATNTQRHIDGFLVRINLITMTMHDFFFAPAPVTTGA